MLAQLHVRDNIYPKNGTYLHDRIIELRGGGGEFVTIKLVKPRHLLLKCFSTMLRLEFGTVPTVWHLWFCFSVYYLLYGTFEDIK
jgi:hypothetical protein